MIWDPIGGPIGISVAETLVQTRPVSLVVPDQIAGTLLSLTGDLAAASTRLAQAGVTVVKRSELVKVGPDDVVLGSKVDGSIQTIACAALVDTGHRIPARDAELLTGETRWSLATR
ncbi:MAG: hypothetical protein R2706_14040 [Acidimicrobiales bacterium]